VLITALKNHPIRHQATLFVDIAGLKQMITQALAPLLPPGQYVSLHPMRGHPLSGPMHSEHITYEHATMLGVTTTLTPASQTLLHHLLTSLQCDPVQWMSAGDHDAWIAYSSHIPHILAKTLSHLSPPPVKAKAGTSLSFMEHLAAMQPELWADLLFDKRQHLLPLLSQAITQFTALQDALVNGDVRGWLKP
jgi:prephenate dehydrogenase